MGIVVQQQYQAKWSSSMAPFTTEFVRTMHRDQHRCVMFTTSK